MLGNAWEWVDGGEPARRTLRGGSFVDYDPLIAEKLKEGSASSSSSLGDRSKQPANHAITPGTRMETTQDSGSANTSFRCASPAKSRGPARKGGGGRKGTGAGGVQGSTGTGQEL